MVEVRLSLCALQKAIFRIKIPSLLTFSLHTAQKTSYETKPQSVPDEVKELLKHPCQDDFGKFFIK